MSIADRHDNALTTTSDTARDQYVTGVDHILAATHGGVDAFAAAIAADPDFALAHAGLARAAMYAGDMAGARAAIASAQTLAHNLTAREHAHIAIFALLLSGRAADTRAAVMDHVRDHPRDVLIAQICTNIFGLIGLSGDADREAQQLAFTTALLPHLSGDWWLLSVHAQAICETGRPDEALTVMERSLALNAANANASHFKAHALYENGAHADGRAYLAQWLSGYDKRALLHGHLSWHGALWALEQGDEVGLWAVMDADITPEASHALPLNALTDAASLLHRAALAGVHVRPERWRRLSNYAARTFPDPGQSFGDMHAALAHAMAGNGERLARLTEAQTGYAADLVRPVARAWAAIARQDWDDALQDLTPVMAQHVRFGGSRAQRDLLELTWLNLMLKLGRTDEARQAMSARRPIFSGAAPVAGYA